MKYQIANVEQSPVDQRDYIYHQKYYSFPRRFTCFDTIFEIENQHQQGACVGNGVGSTLESFELAHGGQPSDVARQFIYDMGRFLEGRPNKSGMFARTAYKVLNKFGVPLESEYPYNPEESYREPTEAEKLLGAGRKIGRYEFVVGGPSHFGALETQEKIDRAKSALMEKLRQTFAFSVTPTISDMIGPFEDHAYRVAGPGLSYVGGHLMYPVGWDDDLNGGGFFLANSWGNGWGNDGIGFFPYGIVNEMFFESWLFREYKNLEVREEPGIRLEYQNQLGIGARIVPEVEEEGQTVDVVVAAMYRGGIYRKVGYGGNDWVLYHGNISDIPASWTTTLGDDNPVRVCEMFWDLHTFAGAGVYVGYRNQAIPLKYAKVCTVY